MAARTSPSRQFLQLLTAIDDVWHNRRADLEKNVDALRNALDRTGKVEPAKQLPGVARPRPRPAAVRAAVRPDVGWLRHGAEVPHHHGARAPAASPRRQRRRARLARLRDDDSTPWPWRHVRPPRWRIRPVLGGRPLARASFREDALRPGAAVRIYPHAWQALGEAHWKQVLEETIGYVLRDLRHQDGGFYSAEDADSLDEHGHSHEGLFYMWTPERDRRRPRSGAGPSPASWYEFRRVATSKARRS